MSVGIIVKGIDDASAYLRKERIRIQKEANIGIQQATLLVTREVKLSIAGKRSENTSVDTGRFLNSVQSKVSNGVGTVYSDVKYADFLEYGTSRMTPRYHFRNTLERNRKKIRQIIQDRLDKKFKPMISGINENKYKSVGRISDVINI